MYARVARSLGALRWSRGLRNAMLGAMAEIQRTDEELAAEDVGGELVAVISLTAWSCIPRAGLEHATLAAAEHRGIHAIILRWAAGLAMP